MKGAYMKQKITISIDDDMIEDIKIEAIKRKTNVSAIINALIKMFLDDKIEINTTKNK